MGAGLGAAAYPNIDRYVLTDNFKHGYKELAVEELEIMNIFRNAGSFYSPIYVVGVTIVNPSSQPNIFFIRKEKVPELKKLIDQFTRNGEQPSIRRL